MITRSIEGKDGIKIRSIVITLRYADDTVIIAETLQQRMCIVVQESEIKGLFLNWNCAKFFTMVFFKSTIIPACNLTVYGKRLGKVNRFIYLGSLFTSDGRCEKDVRRRIGIGK